MSLTNPNFPQGKETLMKRIILCLALLGPLLCGCGAETPALPGVWVNAGQYSEGRDFVETMTLREDGSVTVHLEYQGADYATLEGIWTQENGTLAVDFSDEAVKDRSYSYTLTETTLTLNGGGKEVVYQRSE